MSAFGVALVVAADESAAADLRSVKNTLMQGAPAPRRSNAYARIPMAPTAAVQAVAGLAPDAAILARRRIRSAMTDGDDCSLTTAGRGALMNWVSMAAKARRWCASASADGRSAYEVHYSDYRDIRRRYMFPRQGRTPNFPRAGATRAVSLRTSVDQQACAPTRCSCSCRAREREAGHSIGPAQCRAGSGGLNGR